MKIAFVYADEPAERNSSIWRCLWPVEALRRAGHDAWLVHIRSWLPRDPRAFDIGVKADVIVYERVLTGEVAGDMRFWKSHGKKIVVDFDDAYQHMPQYVPSYCNWHGPPQGYKEPLLDSLKRNLPLADLLHTPSALLSQDWAAYAQKTAVVRNFPALKTNENWAVPYPIRSKKQVGWGGTATHLNAWRYSGIVPAVHRERILIFAGDAELRALLPVAHFEPGVPAPMWPFEMGRIGIGVAPIAGEYDRRRSWIKCLEYGLKGIPWIASDMEPYQDCHGGYRIENETGAWRAAIQRLRDDEAEYERLSQEGREWAWQQDIDLHIQERVSLYERL